MRVLDVADLGGGRRYGEVLALQERLHGRRVAGEIGDRLLLLEHARVYTLGRSAEAGNVLPAGEAPAEVAAIERVASSRGGDVTYHGPGQLVGYPVVHLGDAGLRVVEYVGALEEVLIRVAGAFGVRAGRDGRNRGAWVGDAKLGAVGIRVSRQVAMHGFSLNVAPRLEDYAGIVACGLRGAGVTSLARLLGAAPEMAAVKAAARDAFAAVLGYGVVRVVTGGDDDGGA